MRLDDLLGDDDLLLRWALHEIGDVSSPTAHRILVEAKRADLAHLLAVIEERGVLSDAS